MKTTCSNCGQEIKKDEGAGVVDKKTYCLKCFNRLTDFIVVRNTPQKQDDGERIDGHA